MSKTVLEFDNISKSFFGVQALQDVSLTLRQGHVLGFVGENGAGKTTLMNILGGVIPPDQGKMKLKGKDYTPRNPAEAARAGVAFIHQELNLFTNLSIADNLFIDRFPRVAGLPFISKRTIRRKTAEQLKSVNLDVSCDMLVERLSPGERQLVEIARALSTGAEIIIFDEPTTSLTARETKRLFALIERLRAVGKSIIYISHNLGDVLYLADDIVVIRDGIVVGEGPKEQFPINRMISLMVGRDISQIYPPPTTKPSKEAALEVRGLSQSGVVRNISFTLHRAEVLGLFGLMGSGRTELARMIFGLDAFERGTILLGSRKGMAFVTENRREEGLLMDACILDNVALVSMPEYTYWRAPRMVDQSRLRTAVRRVVDSLRIKTGPIERQLAKNLSGGNQQKTVIAKWLMSKSSVFIMDEPTRGIDVGAKVEIYKLINDLAGRGTAVLFISSELEELMACCDRILVMSNGEIQGRFRRAEFDEEQILHAAFRGHKGHGGD